MKVYVITKGSYDDYGIVAVRTNRRLAQLEIKQLNEMHPPHFDGDEYCVETYDTKEQIPSLVAKKMVTISVSSHEDFLESAKKLAALEAAGVDNWEGYDHAMDILRQNDGE